MLVYYFKNVIKPQTYIIITDIFLYICVYNKTLKFRQTADGLRHSFYSRTTINILDTQRTCDK